MNRELVVKWIKALRSGKYKQAIGPLRTLDNRFCTQGVLHEISGHVPFGPARFGGVFGWAEDEYDPKLFTVPVGSQVFGYKLEAKTETANGVGLSIFKEAGKMNNLGFTFAAIADKIEEMAGISKEIHHEQPVLA